MLLLLFLPALALAGEVVVKSNYPLKKGNLESFVKTAPPEVVVKLLKAIPEIKSVELKREKGRLVILVERYPLVKKVEVKGNFYFREEEVKSILGLEEGTPLLEENEEVYEELLKAAYREEGFLNADAKVKLVKDDEGFVTVKVKVSEGNLYFLKDARFEGARAFSKEELFRASGLKRGSVYNLYAVEEAEERLEQFYRSRGFFGSFVFLKEVKKEELGRLFWRALYPEGEGFFNSLSEGLKNAFTHPLATLKALVGSGRGAVPVYEVYEGEHYEIRFTGNRFFSSEELLKAVDLNAVSVDYFLLEQARRKLLELYRKKGFLEAEVSYELKKNEVRFFIKEGPRYRARLVVNGNELTLWYDEEKIEGLVNELVERLKREGYLDARAEKKLKVFKERKEVLVEVKLEKGYRYLLAGFEILSEGFEDIEQQVKWKLPTVLDYELIEHALTEVRQRLHEEGYFDGEVSIEVETRRKGNALYFFYFVRVKRGPRYRYGGALVYGLEKTRLKEVSYMLVKEEYFSKEAEELSLWHLVESDVFKSARVENYADRKEKKVYRLVYLEEKKRGLFELALGYSTFEGFKVGGAVVLRNLLGIGLINKNRYLKSDLYELYELALRDNFLFTRWLFGEGKLFKSYEDHAYFDLYSDGWSLMAGNRITRNLSTAFSFSSFTAETTQTEPSTDALKKLSFLFTHRKYFRLSYAAAWGDRAYSYAKLFARAGKEFRHSYGFRVKLWGGALWGNEPIFERFFLGGFKYLKGYDYESIGGPRGGTRAFYLAPEAYYLIKETFELIAGLEAGNAKNDEGKLFDAPYWNLLFSLGVRTPVGLIRADAAYPMRNTALSTGKLRFYLSVELLF
ncbi:MAG: hypothetical protein GXO03_01005 [Aquificae bacterium]|nr:hypothetical protein [Aquificota bacterium]